MMRQTNSWISGLAAVGMLLGSVPSAAQTTYIPWSNKAESTTIATVLEAFKAASATVPDIGARLNETRSSVAVVFVPGILGSTLTEADGKNIYGDLSDPSTLISRLQLPEKLIDENVESGVRPKLLRKLGPMDFYGEAVGAIERWGTENGVRVLPCAYDWRRDIRAGARDLDRCIATLEPQYKDLVIVAHSMGGLVTWTWAQQRANGTFSKDRRIVQITVLGSPLKGSCEIIRMIQSGYIQPTLAERAVSTNLKPLTNLIERFVSAFTNQATSQFTQGIRPHILSWPGAIELSPPARNAPHSVSCVGIPAAADSTIGTPSTSYYDPEFWEKPAGKQMLGSYTAPPSLSKVLAKAKEFRNRFKVEALSYPTWLYSASTWFVPDEAAYQAPQIAAYDHWSTRLGDGRVPYESAKNGDNDTIFTRQMGVQSVHGNLPADPDFFADYFGNHLPQALAALWVADLAEEASAKPDWMTALGKVLRNGPDPQQVRTAMEPQGLAGQESPLVKHMLDATTQFNASLCEKRKDCVTTYEAAKAKVAGAPPSARPGMALKQFSAVVDAIDRGSQNFAFAEGNRGLVLARQMDWHAAASSLQQADETFKDRQARKPEPSKPEADFAAVVRRNLGKSLLEAGQCKKAEPYLREAASTWSYAREALAKPCNDLASGLQYCFEDGGYCHKR